MIWHIFKKDCWLVWPFIFAVLLVQIANATWLTVVDPFSSTTTSLLTLCSMLSVALLTGRVVHQDPIPGDEQDWCVRPIRRGQLLAAKLLFVLVAIHAPIFVVDMFAAVGQGFPFGQSLGTALSRNIGIALAISLPSLVLAVVTRNLGGMFLGGLLIFGGWVALQVAREGDYYLSELRWFDDMSIYAIVLAAAGVVLPLQYFRRRTAQAIAITCIAVLLMPLVSLLPWQAEYAIQQRWSAREDSASDLSVQFAPEARLSRLDAQERGYHGTGNQVTLPIRVVQPPGDSELLLDNVTARIYDTQGTILFRQDGCIRIHDLVGRGTGYCSRTDFRSSAVDPAPRIIYYHLDVPDAVYQRIKHETVRVEIEHSGTAFRMLGSYALPADAFDVDVPGIGRCTAKFNPESQGIDLRCRTASRTVPCLAVTNTPDSAKVAETLCPSTSYNPYLPRISPSMLTSFGRYVSSNSRARRGDTLSNQSIAIRAYEPDKQWMATVIIPKIRLSEWAFESPAF